MAIMITEECINCGACEPECPNTAIYEGGAAWQLVVKHLAKEMLHHQELQDSFQMISFI